MFWQQLHLHQLDTVPRWHRPHLFHLLAPRRALSCLLSAPTKKFHPFSLVGPQFIGFTAVALFGRLADVIRPALVAKRVKLPLSSQIAVYTIERMFDLGAAAIIFSSALLFAPSNLPHHEIFIRTGLFLARRNCPHRHLRRHHPSGRRRSRIRRPRHSPPALHPHRR